MRMRANNYRIGILLLILAFMVLFYVNAIADNALLFPTITETECKWDGNGNLISETAHDLTGTPAINSRGFYKAEYTWDENNNLISETYYDLDGKQTETDKGYAHAEYTYHVDHEGESHILTEHISLQYVLISMTMAI